MNGTRVLTKRYKLFHKASNIICWVHLDLQNEMSETSQTIRNCIVQAPICECRIDPQKHENCSFFLRYLFVS